MAVDFVEPLKLFQTIRSNYRIILDCMMLFRHISLRACSLQASEDYIRHVMSWQPSTLSFAFIRRTRGIIIQLELGSLLFLSAYLASQDWSHLRSSKEGMAVSESVYESTFDWTKRPFQNLTPIYFALIEFNCNAWRLLYGRNQLGRSSHPLPRHLHSVLPISHRTLSHASVWIQRFDKS